MKLYVGNLSPDTTREELLAAFQAHGDVASVTLPCDHMKNGLAGGTHRGYAFVVMRDRTAASAARTALEGKSVHGKAMSVSIARPVWTPHYVN